MVPSVRHDMWAPPVSDPYARASRERKVSSSIVPFRVTCGHLPTTRVPSGVDKNPNSIFDSKLRNYNRTRVHNLWQQIRIQLKIYRNLSGFIPMNAR